MRTMPQPLVISIPHRLGQEEAVRRLRSGFESARGKFGQFFSIQEQTWSGNHLQFSLTGFGQSLSGTIDVLDDQVRLEVVLPWLLAMIADKIQPLIRKEATLLLEKK